MTQPIDFSDHAQQKEGLAEGPAAKVDAPLGIPSNAVYARVGDTILRAAQDGVRRGMPPQDIIREIFTAHNVHLNVGELRLLLASRRIPQ